VVGWIVHLLALLVTCSAGCNVETYGIGAASGATLKDRILPCLDTRLVYLKKIHIDVFHSLLFNIITEIMAAAEFDCYCGRVSSYSKRGAYLPSSTKTDHSTRKLQKHASEYISFITGNSETSFFEFTPNFPETKKSVTKLKITVSANLYV
jgi:hypothetical protein